MYESQLYVPLHNILREFVGMGPTAPPPLQRSTDLWNSDRTESSSVLECVEEAFGYVNLDWREYVAEDPRYLRPTEVPLLQADPSEAKRRLGWEPRVTFRDLVRIMVDANLEAAGLPAPGKGKRALLMVD